MRIHWSQQEIAALRAALDACEDAELTGADEYVVDLYQVQSPLSLQLAFEQDGISILAAEFMAYDEEMDGWYLAGPADDAAALEAALRTLL